MCNLAATAVAHQNVASNRTITPYEFKNRWTDTDKTLSRISRTGLERFNLLQSTVDFLSQAGLPVHCEPDLNFVNDTDDKFYGINKLTDQYDFEGDKEKYEKYVVIGSCRDGDAIAIDTSDNDKIVELDHEDLFSSMYFNSSISTLADFLVLYSDFEQNVLQGQNTDDNFQCYNFTDLQFDQLKSKMFSVDSKAITEEGFWKRELEIMLSLRHEKYGTV